MSRALAQPIESHQAPSIWSASQHQRSAQQCCTSNRVTGDMMGSFQTALERLFPAPTLIEWVFLRFPSLFCFKDLLRFLEPILEPQERIKIASIDSYQLRGWRCTSREEPAALGCSACSNQNFSSRASS